MIPDNLDTLGKRLRFARVSRRLGSRELARLAEISEGHPSLIEGGRNFNDLDALRRLASALDVSIDWLVNGGDVPGSLQEAATQGGTFQHPASPAGAHGAS